MTEWQLRETKPQAERLFAIVCEYYSSDANAPPLIAGPIGKTSLTNPA
jgi:hypothetical protein